VNILVVSTLLPSSVEPERSTFNWEQVRALAGLVPLIAVAPVPWTPPVPARRAWERFRLVPGCETVDGIEVHHPRYLVVPRRARAVQGWSYARRLDDVISSLSARFPPDAIFATWAYPDLYAATRVGHRRRLPVIGKVHGSDLNLLPGLGLERRIRAALSAADRVVAVGETLRRTAVALGAPTERTVVVRNGIDLERFAPRDRRNARAALGLPLDGELLLYVGRLTPEKGPDLLIDALGALAARRPAVQLALVGAGSLEPALRRRAESLGLGQRCRFVGRRRQTEVARWLNAATLLVLPSRAEGVPNVLLEAVASGTPVVATRVGGVAEALEEGVAGLLVPPGAPPALAHAIAMALDRAFAPHAVRATLRAQSWAASARGILGALQEGIREHAARTDPGG
jgi:glycosyltransferase involved in cell wall biosynthesis